MTKFIFLLPLLTSCGAWQRTITHYTGDLTTKCFRGVTYIQSDSGLALGVDKEGRPVTCEGDDE